MSDLWGGFESDIRRASERYLPDVILVGRLSSRGGDWEGNWTLYLPDKTNRWQTRADSRLASTKHQRRIQQPQTVAHDGNWPGAPRLPAVPFARHGARCSAA